MFSYTSFRHETSVIWAVISDGKNAYIFKYHKEEKVVVFRDCCNLQFGDEQKKYDQNTFSMKPVNDDGNYHKTKCAKVEDSINKSAVCKSALIRNDDGSQDFLLTIAARLEQAYDDKAFDYLVIIAPRDSLNTLQNSLNDEVRDRVLENMPEGYIYDKKGAILVLRKGTAVDGNVERLHVFKPLEDIQTLPCMSAVSRMN